MIIVAVPFLLVSRQIGPFQSYRLTNVGGPQFARNIVLRNFTANGYRAAGALTTLFNGKNVLNTMNKFAQFDIDSSDNLFWIQPFPNAFDTTSNLADSPKFVAVSDIDGSWTGILGGWILSTTSFLTVGRTDCTVHAEWNAQVCPPTLEGYVQVEIDNNDVGNTDFGTSVTNDEYPFSPSKRDFIDVAIGNINEISFEGENGYSFGFFPSRRGYIRATWYAVGYPNDYINVTGGDTSNVVRTRYDANMQGRGGKTLFNMNRFLKKFLHEISSEIDSC